MWYFSGPSVEGITQITLGELGGLELQQAILVGSWDAMDQRNVICTQGVFLNSVTIYPIPLDFVT